MNTETFRKVYIKSEKDLPKESNWYFTDRGMQYYFSRADGKWCDNVIIDWYLQPIEQPESFRVDNFNQKRINQDLEDDVEMIKKQFEQPDHIPDVGEKVESKSAEECLRDSNILIDAFKKDKPLLYHNVLKAMEKYASQFSKPGTLPSDEEIENAAYMEFPYDNPYAQAYCIGAEALRDGKIPSSGSKDKDIPIAKGYPSEAEYRKNGRKT